MSRRAPTTPEHVAAYLADRLRGIPRVAGVAITAGEHQAITDALASLRADGPAVGEIVKAMRTSARRKSTTAAGGRPCSPGVRYGLHQLRETLRSLSVRARDTSSTKTMVCVLWWLGAARCVVPALAALPMGAEFLGRAGKIVAQMFARSRRLASTCENKVTR